MLKGISNVTNDSARAGELDNWLGMVFIPISLIYALYLVVWSCFPQGTA
jgi:hypothetical protein